MKYLKVNLWGKEIGRLVWDSATRRPYFMYNPESDSEIPDIAPLLSPAKKRNIITPIYGDERPLYQGLPPFIADSLPDAWGNTLFDRWAKDNRIPRNKVTPLYKLMFIGTRGMGALEYEPYAAGLTHTRAVDIKSLHDISLKVLEDRSDIVLSTREELTLQALLAVGTSAGGRQMKAIIAINNETGEIRSGQTDGLEGFEYYILKFGEQFHANSRNRDGIPSNGCRRRNRHGGMPAVARRRDKPFPDKALRQKERQENPCADFSGDEPRGP